MVVAGVEPTGCASVSLLRSRVILGSSSFNPSQFGVNACTVSPGGFGSAAGFTVLEWLRQFCRFHRARVESPRIIRTSDTDKSPFRLVAESLLYVGDVARTCVLVVEPLVRDMHVTQILNPCHLLPSFFGVQTCFSAV